MRAAGCGPGGAAIIGSIDWNEVHSELVTATPISPLELLSIEKPGVYAWWDLHGVLSSFWPEGFPEVDPTEPLYVGIAETALMERGGEIHLEKTRMSTMRRSLSALLQMTSAWRIAADR